MFRPAELTPDRYEVRVGETVIATFPAPEGFEAAIEYAAEKHIPGSWIQRCGPAKNQYVETKSTDHQLS